MRAEACGLGILFGLVLFALAPAAPSLAQQAPHQRPMLMLDVGMHTGPVRALTTAADLFATGADDKSIRVWDVASGATRHLLHVPIGSGSVGVIDALALSPDARFLLASSPSFDAVDPAYPEASIYLFDLTTERLLARLRGFTQRVEQLAYTPDGDHFAGLLGPAGLRVWTRSGETVRLRVGMTRDAAIAHAPAGDRLRALAIQADGTILVLSRKGRLDVFRIVGAVAERVRSLQLPLPGDPFSMAVAPDGRSLAVGFVDAPGTVVIDLVGGEVRTLSGPRGLGDGNLAAVTWWEDPHGVTWLLAGGTVQDRTGHNVVVAWPEGRSEETTSVAVGQDAVTALSPTATAGVIVATADPRWARLGLAADGTLSVLAQAGSPGPDMRAVATRGMRVAADGSAVVWHAANRWRRLDLERFELDDVATPPAGLRRAGASDGALRVEGWHGSRSPTVNGAPVYLEAEERSLSVDVHADFGALVGTDYHLRLFNHSGSELARRVVASPVWAVAIAPDAEWAVAAHGDGTLRWYSLAPRAPLHEIMAVFAEADGRRWVAWTPDGRFTHGPYGGEQLVGFLQNGAPGNLTGRWLGLDQLYRRLYDPAGMRQLLQAPAQWTALGDMDEVDAIFARVSLPELQLLAYCVRARMPADVATRGLVRVDPLFPAPAAGGGCQDLATDTARVTLPRGTRALDLSVAVDRREAEVVAVEAFVNGRNAGRVVVGDIGRREATFRTDRVVPLGVGTNHVTFRATTEDGLFAQSNTVTFEVPRQQDDRSGRLVVLAAGIDAYRGEITPLRSAAADARSFVDAVQAHLPSVYRKMEATLLLDDGATRDAILRELRSYATSTAREDAVLVYLAGHGVTTADGEYHFVTHDATTVEGIARHGLDGARLAAQLAEIPSAKVFLFLDTCYAGAIDARMPGYLANASGRLILAASTAEEEALDTLGENGLFNTAVQQALEGDWIDAEVVDALDLGSHVRRVVHRLAEDVGHQQSAVFMATGLELPEFPVAEVR